MKAQPGPIVSGNHFFPNAPLLWVKRIPACAVMSRKWISWPSLNPDKHHNHRDKEKQNNPADFFEKMCLTGNLQPQRLSLHVLRISEAAPRRARESPAFRCCLQDAAGDKAR